MNKLPLKKITILFAILTLSLLIAAPITAQEDPVTITYWDWLVTQGPAMDEAIAAFEEANPGINVEKTTQVVTEYPNLINLAFQSDSAPDIFMLPQGIPLATLVENGWLAPLSDFEDFETFRETFPDPDSRFVEGSNMIDGNVYSSPSSGGRPWLQLYINEDVYTEAGLVNEDGSFQYPTTWEELIENARVIKEETGKYGLGFGGTTNNIDWFWWACQLSGPFYTDKFPAFDVKTGEFTFAEQPCYRDMIDSLLTLRDEDLMLPESLSLDDESIRVRFANGDFAHLFAGDWVIGGWETTNPDFVNFNAVPVPLMSGTEEPTSRFYYAPGGAGMGINANSEHLEAAWEFYKFLQGPVFSDIWAKAGHGVNFWAPGEPEEYATTKAQQSILAMEELAVPGPSADIRNPEVSTLALTVTGQTPAEVLTGIYTDQITDIDAALEDLDARYDAALEQAIADANSAGADLSREDFIFEDWDPTQPYSMTQ